MQAESPSVHSTRSNVRPTPVLSRLQLRTNAVVNALNADPDAGLIRYRGVPTKKIQPMEESQTRAQPTDGNHIYKRKDLLARRRKTSGITYVAKYPYSSGMSPPEKNSGLKERFERNPKDTIAPMLMVM